MRMRTPLLLLLLLGAVVLAAATQARDDVTIYRCTDAQGRVALQDAPCADGQQQEVRTMLRPQDPPPRAVDATPAASPDAAQPAATEVVIRTPPRPMYECVTPEGERYTSDSGDGNPRPVPVWSYGAPIWPGPGPGAGPGVPPGPGTTSERRAAGIASPGMSTSPGPSLTAPSRSHDAPPPPPPRPRPPGHHHGYPIHGYGYNDGWIRDQCHPLPQSQICSRLSDRRTEIRRRVFNAQPTERAGLRAEERDITARLNDDCDIR